MDPKRKLVYTKLSNEKIRGLRDAVELGCAHRDACRLVGVSPSSFYDWMRIGRRLEKEIGEGERDIGSLSTAEQQYLTLVVELETAEAGLIKRNLYLLQRAAQQTKHWTAAAWMLERKRPDEFGRRQRLEIGEIAEVRDPNDVIQEMARRTLGEPAATEDTPDATD